MTMMRTKKKLKDPNEKSAIQKFVGGKIPHYLAVAAFLYALVGVGGFLLGMITGAEQKERERIEKYVNETIDERLNKIMPDTTGNVLRQYLPKKK
jgi:hypothetical protein